MRPIGTCLSRAALAARASASNMRATFFATRGVSIRPGITVFTRMRSAAYCCAAIRAKWITAALLTLYARCGYPV
ncbi:hypothetical protein D9M72_222810 [compost metagenome]